MTHNDEKYRGSEPTDEDVKTLADEDVKTIIIILCMLKKLSRDMGDMK